MHIIDLFAECPDCGTLCTTMGDVQDEVEFECPDCLAIFNTLGYTSPDDVEVECPKCKGSGQGVPLPILDGGRQIYMICSLCGGACVVARRTADKVAEFLGDCT